jgi:hypothetical protein
MTAGLDADVFKALALVERAKPSVIAGQAYYMPTYSFGILGSRV